MISIKNAYTFAWLTFKKKWKLFLAICLVLFATSLLSRVGVVFGFITSNRTTLIVITVVFWLLYLVVNAFINAGFKKMLLGFSMNKKVVFTDVLTNKKDALKFLLGQLIVFFVVFCIMFAFVLLLSVIIPLGVSVLWAEILVVLVLLVLLVLLSSRFGFWAFAMFDKNVSAIRAFGLSRKITQGKALSVMKFYVLTGFVAGIALLIVAVIPVINFILILTVLYFVVSLVSLASVHMYQQLSGQEVHIQSQSHKNTFESDSHLSTDTDVVVQSQEIEASTA
jgi:hypothetical protein